MGGFPFRAAVALLLVASLAHSENFVAINSYDSRDVLSGIFYANVKGYPARFMPTPGGSPDVFAAKVGSGQSVLLIQSSESPVSGFVEPSLRAKGNEVEIYGSQDGGDTNLALASRSGAQSFIIVDSAYSESAISAIPYAAYTSSYVILADRTNIGEIKEIVRGKGIIIYGYVDQPVKDALAEFSPAQIGGGEDKYADNVEIVSRLMDESGATTPIVADGSVIVDSIAGGKLPILLSGKAVPQVAYEFVKSAAREGRLTGVLLIGNSLVGPVNEMRARIGGELADEGNISFDVEVDFPQAVPSAQSGALMLDTFTVPAYKPTLNITEIVYNHQSGKVMVGLENTGEGPLYYTLELRVLVDGEELKAFGEPEAALIEQGESGGVEYALDLSSIPQGSISARALVKYGSAKKSLDSSLTSEGDLAAITYADATSVSVRLARYDKGLQRMLVSIKNDGSEPAFVFTKLLLVDESGSIQLTAPSAREIEPSAIYIEEFPLIFTDKELGLNKEATVSISYGGRRGFLNKNAVYKLPLGQEAEEGQAGMQLSTAALGAAAAIICLAALFAIYKFAARKKESGG